MTESTPISLAKLSDKTYIFSLTPFDASISGEFIAYPGVNHDQLKLLREGTPEQVQRVLASLTNL